jgi:SEC-C motif-containing protein
LIQGARPAPTAEALMRSRYSAHVKAEVEYIYESTHPTQRRQVNRESVAEWCQNAEWLGFEIVETAAGGPDDDIGTVEFAAHYREKGKAVDHREVAEFKREDGRWYFVDGRAPKTVQFVRQGPKVGRNDPCSCGSGKKYKKCCGA